MAQNSTIFYSWQSDLPNATNRGLIERALEGAVKLLREAATIAVEPVIDRDTAGVPGAPDIAATIFDKIERADICVCDVSVVNSRAVEAGFARPAPNPNVLIEAGYALKALGRERLVLVANSAFGPPEQLPFDLRYRRIVTYHSAPDATERAIERKRLQSALFVALESIYQNGFPEPHVEEAPPPPIPIEQGLFGYITGSALVRRYDERLAGIYRLPLELFDCGDYGGLKEQLKFFSISTVRELDDLLREHGEVAFYMGYGWRPSKRICAGYILGLLMHVLAARLGSMEEVERYANSLTRISGGWWRNVFDEYEVAKRYAEQNRGREPGQKAR